MPTYVVLPVRHDCVYRLQSFCVDLFVCLFSFLDTGVSWQHCKTGWVEMNCNCSTGEARIFMLLREVIIPCTEIENESVQSTIRHDVVGTRHGGSKIEASFAFQWHLSAEREASLSDVSTCSCASRTL